MLLHSQKIQTLPQTHINIKYKRDRKKPIHCSSYYVKYIRKNITKHKQLDKGYQMIDRWLSNQAGRLEVDVIVETRHISHILRHVDKKRTSTGHSIIHASSTHGRQYMINEVDNVPHKIPKLLCVYGGICPFLSLKQRQRGCLAREVNRKCMRSTY